MGVFYETIPESLKPWILEQQMFCVATAPLSGTGHINVSPKGGTNFGILSPTQFWYMDLTGSGVETHAHLHEPHNGRIVIMFMAFAGPPRIVRLWGQGHPLEHGTPEFTAFATEHKVAVIPGSRSIITVDIDQCASSCGFSVPFYEFKAHREVLNDYFAKKQARFEKGDERESMERYWAWKSQLSIDGLPAMKRGYEYALREKIRPLNKMVGKAGEKVQLGLAARRKVRFEGWYVVVLVFVLGVLVGGIAGVALLAWEVV